jgi:hypothetical protein
MPRMASTAAPAQSSPTSSRRGPRSRATASGTASPAANIPTTEIVNSHPATLDVVSGKRAS